MSLIHKYSQQVPRYTSYPTAPQFTSKIDEKDYSQWLAELPETEEVSLYLHIPFCKRLCWFCGCHTKIVTRHEPITEYLKAIEKEITLIAQTLKKRLTVRHIHFGGGSPSTLKPDEFHHLMNHLRLYFSFSEQIEIAIEVEPRTVTPDSIQAFANSGVNRISLGVQDFTPEVQKAINRIQTFEETETVLSTARSFGIHHFNLDLIYGLPLQTLDGFVDSIDKTILLRPSRVSLFGYAHVPWMKSHQKLIDTESLPNAQERTLLYQMASNRLQEHGYVQIGLDHFSQSNDEMALAYQEKTLHRNFQGYTTDTASTLIGFGASAIGYLPQGYIQNNPHIRNYQNTVEKKTLPIERGIAITPDDFLRREVINQLMCYLEVDLRATCSSFGKTTDYFSEELERLIPMEEDGIVQVKEGYISIDPKHRLFIRLVCSVFDIYLKEKQKRYSQAL